MGNAHASFPRPVWRLVVVAGGEVLFVDRRNHRPHTPRSWAALKRRVVAESGIREPRLWVLTACERLERTTDEQTFFLVNMGATHLVACRAGERPAEPLPPDPRGTTWCWRRTRTARQRTPKP